MHRHQPCPDEARQPATWKPTSPLSELDDRALLSQLKRLVGSSNQLTALMLAHLAEVDARAAYRQWACPSLFIYCVYELRLSEDEAQRRCRAARVARQFPLLFEMLADGSIHLTGILLLAPYLTRENHVELLARSRYRRKREIEKLLAEVAPRCDVPSLIQPLRAETGVGRRAPSTWSAMMESRTGYVRQLTPGDGPACAPVAPAGWLEAVTASVNARVNDNAVECHSGGSVEATPAPSDRRTPLVSEASAGSASTGGVPADAPGGVGGVTVDSSVDAADENDGCTRADATSNSVVAGQAERTPPLQSARAPLSASTRYKIQFSADQEYVELLEHARDLLAHQIPDRDLPQVQRLAIEALVEKLERRKHGATKKRCQTPLKAPVAMGKSSPLAEPDAGPAQEQPLPYEQAHEQTQEPQRELQAQQDLPAPESQPNTSTVSHSRHVPAAIRRTVWERDGGRCSYVDPRGVRCRETAALEFHHRAPHARGGPTSIDNLCLYCRAHNGLAAEEDFGRTFMERKKRREPT